MEELEKNKFIEAIRKTGFELERKISLLLESKGWTLINNRYYLDDTTEIMREIDIIAYKTYKIKSITFCNSLVISCKKSEKHIWGFLTKPINALNTNLFPVNIWSNSKILNAMKYQEEFVNFIKEKIKVKEDFKDLFSIEKNIFAFQEIIDEGKNYKANTDSNIFGSIISVIKALAYELSILNNRKKGINVLYNFDLLSIFDGRMVEYDYTNEEPDLKDIDEIRYINRYIINKKDDHYRIYFMNLNKLNNFLDKYDLFIKEQKNFHYKFVNSYLDKFKYDDSIRNLHLDEIIKGIGSHIKINTESYNFGIELKRLSYISNKKILQLELDGASENEILLLNLKKGVIETVKHIVKQYTYYNGKIEFTKYEENIF